MNPKAVHRLPAALENAVQRVKLAARASVERTIESLGLAALASKDVFHRDSLLGAQFELNRKSAVFSLTFNEAFDQRVMREVAPASHAGGETSWDALSLVDDHEVEIQVSAERFGLEITHACEWELRELETYIVSLLGPVRAEQDRNPLRPEIVGQAMIRAVESVSERPDVRKVLNTEFGRTLGALLRATYADIIADLRQAGVQPAGLAVRHSETRSGTVSGFQITSTRAASLEGEGSAAPRGPHRVGDSEAPYVSRGSGTMGGFDTSSRPAPYGRAGGASVPMGLSRGTPIGSIDPGLMQVIRRLAFAEVGGADSGPLALHDVVPGGGAPVLPNLIRAHRDELRQASNGSLDHMVIDVIGSLFDQILSDPKVPPQVARQIARLQLPVLRAALGDPSFFSSRRHPVRRFVNRIASLGAAFEDFDESGAQQVLAKVRELVQDVVGGDFDQIETYEHKLAALESFVAELGRRELQSQGDAAELLTAKEDELKLRVLYAQQLQGELRGLSAPDFVRDFVSHVWSQVLLRAAAAPADAERLRRLRAVGRDLFMSVQPKTSPLQRKTFLAELPKLMKDLGEGMDLIAWPDARRRDFFGRLLPAHAEALKAQFVRPLDFNLLARQVDGALDKPPPTPEQLRSVPVDLPILTETLDAGAITPRFTEEEAQRIGLVEEAAVDWSGQVDIDLSAEPELKTVDIAIDGLPAPTEQLEPTRGKSLADHVQIGFAYQMHLEGQWQKVRLAHVSPGRTFFVFNYGSKKHKRTVSLTHRMLVRLCETGRLRAFEQAYLLERATARARRQLAALGGGSSAPTTTH